jgi:hypothetical protein
VNTLDRPLRHGWRDALPANVLVRRLLAPAALTGRELATCALGLGLLAAVTFLSHIRHGSFYADDWGVLLLVKFGPAHSSVIHTLFQYYGRRPGQVLWYAVLESVFGYNAHLQLTLAALLLVGEVLCVYALLRTLGMVVLHAALIAALLLVFPFSDSLWLWSIQTTSTLTAGLYAIGILLALRALESAGGRALALHAASLALYLVALLSYEWFATIGCLVGLLYVYRVGWRRAGIRWAIDVVVIVGAVAFGKLALSDRVTPYRTQTLSGMVRHAGDIARAGARVIASAAVPVGRLDYRVVLGVLALLMVVAALTCVLLPLADPARPALARWLAVAAAGLLVTAAAWAIFAPGISYYSPDAPGTGNRVNGLAGIGIVIFLYASAMLLGTLVLRARGRSRTGRAASVMAVACALFLAAGYMHRASADSSVWNRAANAQRRLLADLHALVPRPPDNARFYAYNFHTGVAAAASVPVFDYPWELGSAIKSSYANGSLGGVVLNARTRWKCGAHYLAATTGPYTSPTGTGYGKAFLVDVQAGRVVRVTSAAQCARVSRGLGWHVSI